MPTIASSPWRQLNLTCNDWCTAEQVAATSLHPLITAAQDTDAVTSWWFVRKGDTWRLRFASPADEFVENATACLLRAKGVHAVTETIYEPEITVFGGPAGMEAAHRLFHADSQHVLAQIAQSGRDLHRELPLVLATRMLRAARQEWYEQGDCWERLATHRDDPDTSTCPGLATVTAIRAFLSATADTPTSPLHARPDWASAFEDAGRKLAELSSRGLLARGLRAVLAHHLLFLFNRHGVSRHDQRMLALAACQAIFGPPDGQPDSILSNPGGASAGAATVGPVTTRGSLSEEDRAARLQDALADQIKGFGAFRTSQVEAAFRTVPRHPFLPGASLDEAYSRKPVVTRRAPDGTSLSSASSPTLVARMLEQLQVRAGQRVLEIGTATGFNAALLASLVGPQGTVVTIELDGDLATEAAANLQIAGYPDVQVICADGALGHPVRSPYDRIIVTAEAWDLAPAWWDQLTPDGRIVVPVRLHGSGLTRSLGLRRQDPGKLVSTSAAVCGFVPMRGISEHADQRIQLTSDAVLKVDPTDQPDAPALAQAFTHPPVEHWTGIPVRHDEPAEHLDLWLATTTTGARSSRLTVTSKACDRGLASPAMRWAGASLYHGGTLAYITARPINDDANELGVTVHGPDSAGLASTTVGLLHEWHRLRPAQPTITARRAPAGNPPPPAWLSRPHTVFTITW